MACSLRYSNDSFTIAWRVLIKHDFTVWRVRSSANGKAREYSKKEDLGIGQRGTEQIPGLVENTDTRK